MEFAWNYSGVNYANNETQNQGSSGDINIA